VEGALEGDDAHLFRVSADRVIFARHLDGGFHRLGAGIRKEDDIRKACRTQPLRELLGLGDAIEVRDVPELLGLIGQGLDQLRMRVAKHIDGDARREIQIALAIGRGQPAALAPLKSEIGTGISRQKMREHGLNSGRTSGDEMKCAAFAGGTF
jgi:hypothetical protein